MHPRRLATALAYCVALMACAGQPDIRGRDSQAQAWARAQRSKDREVSLLTPQTQPHVEQTAATAPAQRPSAPPPAQPRPPVRPPAAVGAMSEARPSSSAKMVGLGTCFAIDSTGTIATAAHVVQGARTIWIRLSTGEIVPATLVRASVATDVAILKIEQSPPAVIGIASVGSAKLGLPVFTVGFPALQLLGSELKYTDGTISGLSGMRDEASMLQISVPVQPGNSGGPLLNDRGEVVGVVVARANDRNFFAATGTLPQNINFATKSENLTLLVPHGLTPPTPARSREEAIERASKAVCLVV